MFWFCLQDILQDRTQRRILPMRSEYLTRGAISTSVLPAFVQVLERKSIEMMNGDRLSEILKTFAGVSVRSYGGRESISTISMNGAGADNTLILLDGIRLNSPQNNQFDASQILKEGIERIEVLNGGMSSLYGSEAIGGVVNIITAKPKPGNQWAEITAGRALTDCGLQESRETSRSAICI